MDVLFGSIDLTDLLPAAKPSFNSGETELQSSYEATPLSAPDLRLLIDRLQVRSLQIKDRVRESLISDHEHFSSLFSRADDVVSSSESAAHLLSGAIQALSAEDCLRIGEIADSLAEKRRKLEEQKKALSIVHGIAVLRGRLASVRADIQEFRFLQAAGELNDLKSVLLIPDGEMEDQDDHGDDPKVYRLLRKDWYVCLDELQRVLGRLVEGAVRFKPENGLVEVSQWVKTGDTEYLELQKILAAMDMIGSLHYGMAKIADQMIKNVLSPIICDRSMTLQTEDRSSGSEESCIAVLKLLSSTEAGESADCHQIYSRLLLAIEFVQNYILFKDTKWTLYFGRLTWSRISELVVSCFLSKVIPDNASQIAEFEEIIKCTAEFEASLQKIGFISNDDTHGEKLSLFAKDLEVHFASQKKKEILATARRMLLECDFRFPSDYDVRSASQDSGASKSVYYVDLLFGREACFVSKAAVHLMNLVHQVLKDVCISSTKVAIELFHAARDAILLYKSIIPVKLEKQLCTINQTAVIVHNDCLYLSQEICALYFEYRVNFPSGIKEDAIFVDVALNLRQMAEDALWKQVELVYFNLKEAVDGANGFQNTHQVQQYESAKFCLDQVGFILEKMRIIWEPILPKTIHQRSMCLLLDFTFKSILKDLLLLEDIAAEETLQLQRLILILLNSLSPLFESLLDDSSEINAWVRFKQKVPSLGKLRKLGDLLDMSLKSITGEWEAGELFRCGFTASEVENLIRGIFTESPLRKECLARIEGVKF